MADKNHSNESDKPGRISAKEIDAAVDPEDDVTSEISGLLAEEFGDAKADQDRDDVKVTDTRLSAHIDPENEQTLETGFVLNDRFEIVDIVHSGGMGVVYKAIDRHRHANGSDRNSVAIKMLRESLTAREDFRIALEREAAKVRSLSHPNIVNVFDFDEHDGRFYLVMEWLEGESVNALLRRTSGQRLAPAFAWPIIEGAAEAIGHAHSHNVVHADINPSNIFITTVHDIKLLDFGVARYVNERHDPEEDRVAWVTQTYASPEILAGQMPEVRDDVFSLGCVAYRLLGGKHPFGGSPSVVAERNGVTVERIPGLPDSDWQILSGALAYSRAGRPDTVGAFLRDSESGGGAGRMRVLLERAVPVAATAAIALMAAWLFWPDTSRVPVSGDTEGPPGIDPRGRPPVAESTPPAAETDVAALIAAAGQAMAERRLVLPENDNARELYRELLRLEPGNAEALRGLREISDEFVERADVALKAGNPRIAAAALTVAAETDARNPAINIVSGFLVAQGDAQLTAARLAVGEGEFGEATALLDQAEQYTHIDPTVIAALREQISREAQEAEFLDRLTVADAYIAEGRLIRPFDANARAVLEGLGAEYGDDPRLRAARQRLAERLLTRAAFAATAGSLTEAGALIDEAESLGVLSTEIEAARSSLAARAESVREPAGPATEPAVLDEPPVEATVEATVVGNSGPGSSVRDEDPAPSPTVADGPATLDEPPVEAAVEATTVEATVAGNSGPGSSVLGEDPTPSPAVADGPAVETRRPTAMRMEDLGIERFVPPSYPRGAQRRGLTGFVDVAFDVNPNGTTSAIEIVRAVPGDVFDRSAAEAVRQWRFAPRDDTVRANVTLRFEIAR